MAEISPALPRIRASRSAWGMQQSVAARGQGAPRSAGVLMTAQIKNNMTARLRNQNKSLNSTRRKSFDHSRPAGGRREAEDLIFYLDLEKLSCLL